MIFLWSDAQHFEEEDEEEGGINDALLDELDGDLADEDILDDVVPPLEIVNPDLDEEEEGEDATAKAFFDDEDGDGDEEGDMDYDSFDDKDDL
jgi:hypothetical protein